MPFSKDTGELLGRTLSVKPRYGFGWRLTEHKKLVIALDEPPGGFHAEVVEALFNGEMVQAVVCRLEVSIAGRRFCWGYFAPHTDSVIDLRVRSVGCDISLSDTKLYLSETIKYPDPEQVCAASTMQLRGQGEVSLLEQLTVKGGPAFHISR
jgi:hypothetical protein